MQKIPYYNIFYFFCAPEICDFFKKYFRNNRMLKISLLFKKFIQTSRVNNSIILRIIINAKLSEYRLNINTKILGDFQICIRVPLIQ